MGGIELSSFDVSLVRDPEEIAEWNRLHDPSRGGYLFSRVDWAETLASALGCGWALFTCRVGDEIAGGALLLEEFSVRGRRICRVPPLPLFTFHLFPKEDLSPAKRIPRGVAVLSSLEKKIRGRYRGITADSPPGLIDHRSLSWSGWRVDPKNAFALDLPLPEQPETGAIEKTPARSEDPLVRHVIERGHGSTWAFVTGGRRRIPVLLLRDGKRLYPVIPDRSKGKLDRQQRIDCSLSLAALPEAAGCEEIFYCGDPWEEWFGCGRTGPIRLVPAARAVYRGGGR